eukprot:4448068-Amphidinium_carterae.1
MLQCSNHAATLCSNVFRDPRAVGTKMTKNKNLGTIRTKQVHAATQRRALSRRAHLHTAER